MLNNSSIPQNHNRFPLGRVVLGTTLALMVSGIVLFAHRAILAVLVVVWIFLATREFLQILSKAEIFLDWRLLSGLNIAIIIAAYLNWLPYFLIAPIGIIFLSAITRRPPQPRVPVYGLFVLIYLGFLPSHLILLHQLNISRWLVLFPLVLTWVNDTAAYALGKLFGKHQLAPLLSPKKTIEGFFSGLLFSALLAGIWLKRFTPYSFYPLWFLALVGVFLGAIAQTGDLFESVFKRAVGVKDSSSVLGEHGGFLDRVDSLLFTIPAFYYITNLLL